MNEQGTVRAPNGDKPTSIDPAKNLATPEVWEKLWSVVLGYARQCVRQWAHGVDPYDIATEVMAWLTARRKRIGRVTPGKPVTEAFRKQVRKTTSRVAKRLYRIQINRPDRVPLAEPMLEAAAMARMKEPATRAQGESLRGEVVRRLRQLPPGERHFLYLRFWTNGEVNDVAEKLGLSCRTAAVRWHRLKKKLVALLKDLPRPGGGRKNFKSMNPR